MRHDARRLTAFVMSTLAVSPRALRPMALRSSFQADRLQHHHLTRHRQCCPGCLRRSRSRTRTTTSSQILRRSTSMLGMDAGLGIAGVSALSALRFFTTTIAPKRVRVVTDIDDTVKSSGNKRLFGVPLGGIDAQCERGKPLAIPFERVVAIAYSRSQRSKACEHSVCTSGDDGDHAHAVATLRGQRRTKTTACCSAPSASQAC